MNDHVKQTLPLLTPRTRGMYLTLGAEVAARMAGEPGDIGDELCYQLALSALRAVEWRSLDAARAALTGPRKQPPRKKAAQPDCGPPREKTVRPGYGPARRSPWTGDYIH